MPKIVQFLTSFWKSEACGQTVLPDKSVFIGQKLVENAKIQKFKYDILSNFKTIQIGQLENFGTKIGLLPQCVIDQK